MKSKKKLLITLSVAIAVLLIAVVAIISISAALNQNITSKVKVHFKPSQHVIGYVSATYTFDGVTHDMTTNGLGNGDADVMFVYNEKQTAKTLQMQHSDLENGKLNVSTEIDNIVLAFKFVNTGYSNFTARLDIGGIITKDNILLSYSRNGSQWTTELLDVKVFSPISSFGQSSAVCYVKIMVDNIALDADFEGVFIWDLVAEED